MPNPPIAHVLPWNGVVRPAGGLAPHHPMAQVKAQQAVRRPYKVSDEERQMRKGVMANSLADLIAKGGPAHSLCSALCFH